MNKKSKPNHADERSLRPKRHAASMFLKLLRPKGPVLMLALPADRGTEKPQAQTCTSPEECDNFIDHFNCNDGYNLGIFYHVNIARKLEKKATKEDIEYVEYLHVDA